MCLLVHIILKTIDGPNHRAQNHSFLVKAVANSKMYMHTYVWMRTDPDIRAFNPVNIEY